MCHRSLSCHTATTKPCAAALICICFTSNDSAQETTEKNTLFSTAFMKQDRMYTDLQLVAVLSEGELLFRHTMLVPACCGEVAELGLTVGPAVLVPT